MAEGSVDLPIMNTCIHYKGFTRWRDKLARDVYNAARYISRHIRTYEQWYGGRYFMVWTRQLHQLMLNESCGVIEFWYRHSRIIALSSTLWGRLNDVRLQYHKRKEIATSKLHRGSYYITGCAREKISIPKQDFVDGVVREDVYENVQVEEDRPSNVFILYGNQNQ